MAKRNHGCFDPEPEPIPEPEPSPEPQPEPHRAMTSNEYRISRRGERYRVKRGTILYDRLSRRGEVQTRLQIERSGRDVRLLLRQGMIERVAGAE